MTVKTMILMSGMANRTIVAMIHDTETSQDGMNVREGVNSFGGGVFRVYQLTMAMTLCLKFKLGAVLHSCFS